MKESLIQQSYEIARERYAAIGVDTDKAIELLEKTPISLHCWQADDVVGFERNEALSGGIQKRYAPTRPSPRASSPATTV